MNTIIEASFPVPTHHLVSRGGHIGSAFHMAQVTVAASATDEADTAAELRELTAGALTGYGPSKQGHTDLADRTESNVARRLFDDLGQLEVNVLSVRVGFTPETSATVTV